MGVPVSTTAGRWQTRGAVAALVTGSLLVAPVLAAEAQAAPQQSASPGVVVGEPVRGIVPLGLRIAAPSYRTFAQTAATLLGPRAAWGAAGLPTSLLSRAASTTVRRSVIDKRDYRWNERTTARGFAFSVRSAVYPDIPTPVQVAAYDHGTKFSAAVHLPATFNARYHFITRTCGKAVTWKGVGFLWSCTQPASGGSLVTRIAVVRAGSAVLMAECAAHGGATPTTGQLAAATRCAQRVVLAQQRASARLFSTATDRVPMPRARAFTWAMTECKVLPCQRVFDVGRWYSHVLVDAKRTKGLTVKRLGGTKVRVTITTRTDPVHNVYFSLRAKYFDAPAVNFSIRVGKAPVAPRVSVSRIEERANNRVLFQWKVTNGATAIRYVVRIVNGAPGVLAPRTGGWYATPAYDRSWNVTILLVDAWNRHISASASFQRDSMLLYDAGPVVVASPGCVAGGRVLHVQVRGFIGQPAVLIRLYDSAGTLQVGSGRWYPVPTTGAEKGYWDGALLDSNNLPICRPPGWSGYVVDGSGTHRSPTMTTKG